MFTNIVVLSKNFVQFFMQQTLYMILKISFYMFSELLTTCDYHSVGLRAVAYTELSVKVAEMSNVYAEKLVEHLLEHKISHWDNSVRELTGQALRKLAPITKGK